MLLLNRTPLLIEAAKGGSPDKPPTTSPARDALKRLKARDPGIRRRLGKLLKATPGIYSYVDGKIVRDVPLGGPPSDIFP